nr:coiled-coil domain-containing protein 39-like isoform X2 [Onthophagus taurus]
MALNMDEVLNEIGWNKGFNIPIANKENQGLMLEFQKLLNQREAFKKKFENETNKFKAYEKHLKFIKEESEQNEKLLMDYDRQIKTEKHKYLKLKCENEKTDQDIKGVRKHIEEIGARNDEKRNELSKVMNRIEKAKVVFNWDLEANKSTEECVEEQLNDENVLKKYSELDARKLKTLEARRQKLQSCLTEKLEKAEKINAAIANYLSMQHKTNVILCEQENEKKLLIKRWQNAVKNLRKRDQEISRFKCDIKQIEECIREREQMLNEEESFFHQQEYHNKEMENEIAELNVLNSRARKELQDSTKFTLEVNVNFTTTKTTLLIVSTKLERARKENKNYKNQMNKINESIQKSLTTIRELEIKLLKVKSISTTATDKAKHFHDLIKNEEMLYKILTKDINKSQDVSLKNRNGLKEINDETTKIKLQIPKTLLTIRNAHNKVNHVMKTVYLQTEMSYRLAYYKYQLKLKISDLEGTSEKKEDKEVMDEKIEEFEKRLGFHREKRIFLKNQVLKVEEEMRRLTMHKIEDAKKLDRLKSKLQDEKMLFEGGVKQTAIMKMKIQKMHVDMNMLRLKLSQLEKALTKEVDNIYDLQRFKLFLETTLKEREIEINTHCQILEASKKNLEETRSRLKADINSKKLRVTQFQQKHHIALAVLGSCEDGEPLSMEEYRTKEEEQRVLLKDEHEDLKRKIEITEKELQAMENTLHVVNKTNDVFLRTLMPKHEEIDRNESDIMKMEDETIKKFDVFKERKRVFKGMQKKLNVFQMKLDLS